MAFSSGDFMQRQRQWACREGFQIDAKDYLASYNVNLFEPLSPQALQEYGDADGGELNSKMRALHSSAALAANVFHYWAGLAWPVRNPLTTAIGAHQAEYDICFEYQPDYPRRPKPNIDIVLVYSNRGEEFGVRSAFALESKLMTDWLNAKSMEFGDYYVTHRDLWTCCGLPQCQELVNDIVSGKETFGHLGADQLLKHTLGLATEFKDRFTLMYLYYDFADMPVSNDHRTEISRFEKAVNGEIDFRWMTYQELYSNLLAECSKLNCMSSHKNYLNKLALRYF